MTDHLLFLIVGLGAGAAYAALAMALVTTYRGTKPANFKDAISIVAIGRFQDGRIDAEKLLVKCPSKYQGAEVEKAYPAAGAPTGKTS